MRTSTEQRRQAVAVARRLLDESEPLLVDVGEAELLCRVLLDCAEVFNLHAPIISAARLCVRPDGQFAMGGPCWGELIRSVQELRRFEERMEVAQ